MENPKQIHRALITMIVTSGVGCIGLSLYLWDARPVIVWGVFLAGSAMAFAMVTVLYGVTIWPVLLLIAYIFDRPSKTGRRRRLPTNHALQPTTASAVETRPARPTAAERSVRPRVARHGLCRILATLRRLLA